MKRILVVLAFCLCSIGLYAQERAISGTVYDETQAPLPGVQVIIEGTTSGAVTDIDGKYNLNVPSGNAVLKFSFIGYEMQLIQVGDKTIIDVTMQESNVAIDEVVVTALGIKREQKALSYNVQKVDGDDLLAVREANFMNSLVGKVAGVQISSSAAGAGGAVRVVMRGTKSLDKNDNALYVIDGVPMFNVSSNASSEGTIVSNPGTNAVADLNPEDIESVSVLTGPSAAALYGSAASNGVILITTKKGEAGKAKITLSNSTTFSTPAMTYDFQNTYGNKLGDTQSWGAKLDTPTSYNPYDFFLKTGVNVINGMTFSTGNERNQTFASVGTTNSTNLLPNSNYSRYNFGIRNTAKFLKDKMTLDLGAQYIIQNHKNMVGSGQYFNPLAAVYLFPRGENFQELQLFERWNEERQLMEQYYPSSTYDTNYDMQNPYWMMYRMNNETKKNRYLLNVGLTYEILDWLNIAGRFKVDNSDFVSTVKRNATTSQFFASEKGFYGRTNSVAKSWYGDVLLNIDKTFSKFAVHANLGASINTQSENAFWINGGLNIVPNFFHVGNVRQEGSKRNESGYTDQIQSVFANVELSYNRMLYLTLTGRNDWASQLAYTDKMSYFYPSVGLSFVASELFGDGLKTAIPYLKVRGSFAEVASAPSRFLTLMQYTFNEQSNQYSYPSVHYNPNLKPENTRSWEVGLSAKFLNSHLGLEFTYYHANTFNQTFYVDASASSGYDKNIVQTGNIQNAGIEAALSYNDAWLGNKLRFNTSLTFTQNKNKIIQLANGAIDPLTGEKIKMEYLSKNNLGYGNGPAFRLYEGGTMGDIYSYQHLKQSDVSPYLAVDENGRLSVEETEYTKLGSILPKFHLGWSGTFEAYGVALGWTFSGRFGGLCVSDTQAILDQYGVSQRTATMRDQGPLMVNGTEVSVQNYFAALSQAIGSFYVYDATNVRLSDLSLNYTIPKHFFNDKAQLTVGLVAKNLWMIYCKAPFDPEVTSATDSNFYQSVDYFQLPSLRSFGFNVKLAF